MLKVLVVGQTPPPYHGQAIMIENLLQAQLPRLEIHHVRMAFSRDLDEVGRFQWRKFLHLFAVIARIVRMRLLRGIKVLYYPPGGVGRAPIYRDILVLLATRWLFSRTVFHIHAGGVSEFVPAQPAWFRFLFRRACQKPDCVIQLSEFSPPDGQYLEARRVLVIPNGIADQYVVHGPRREAARDMPRLLFAGALRRSKGIGVLLEACAQLERRGLRFELECMGEFESRGFEAEVRRSVEAGGLSEYVRFLGRRTADEKWRTYLDADVLCLPTFHEAEGMPLVILEAMQFRLPVVATQWRGIPALVRDGETGFLVPPRDPAALADRLERLLRDAPLRQVMGEKARRRFLEEFTIERWRDRMEKAILGVA